MYRPGHAGRTLPGRATATAISATVNATGTTAVECAVTVTNGDGSFGEYAALVFTNPAQNFYAPLAGPTLLTPRRAPVALGGDATATARFLHVAGGECASIGRAGLTGCDRPTRAGRAPGGAAQAESRCSRQLVTNRATIRTRSEPRSARW